MTIKPIFLLTFLSTLALGACNKATPAGFWKNYKKDCLVSNVSDQGPYGGHRATYWKSDISNPFVAANVLEFAKKNDWTIIDSSKFNADQANKWTYTNKAVFPLTSLGFSDTLLNDGRSIEFPRWFGGPLTVYKFKTGWVTIDPGTNNSIEENGFLVINNDRTQLAVYHLWGE
jgi:hypothetical protein